VLRLPREAAGLVARLEALCPGCARAGALACGDAEIGYGRRFAEHWLAGEPPRGYLVLETPTARDYARWLRDPALTAESVARRVHESFSRAVLVAVQGDYSARSLGEPEVTEVTLPGRLPRCLAAPETAGCESTECCEKSLGSTHVEMRWRDDEAREGLALRLSPVAGRSQLTRTVEGGSVLYGCLADAPGYLEAER
jgi:hypothetical protein